MVTDPRPTARTKLRQLVQAGADKHYTPESQQDYQEMTLRSAISDIERMTERTSLEQYVESNDKRIALRLPHTQIRRISPMPAK